jgi:hypothetical protein
MLDVPAPVPRSNSDSVEARSGELAPNSHEDSFLGFGSGFLFSRSAKLRQSLGVALAREETVDRSSIVSEQRGDFSLGLSMKRARLSVPFFYNLQGQFDRQKSTTSGIGAGAGVAASMDVSKLVTFFAENFNSVFRSYAFSGDDRSTSPASLISGEGATGRGTSRTHFFVLGENWRPDARVSLTTQAQAFTLYRGARHASQTRERETREVHLAVNYALTRGNNVDGRVRLSRTFFQGPLGQQSFDVVLADLTYKHNLRASTTLTLGAGWLFLEKGQSPMRNRASGLALLNSQYRRLKWRIGASRTIETSAPGTRSTGSGYLEHSLSRRIALFHAANYDLVETEQSTSFGSGSRSRQLRLESGVRDNVTREWLWGAKIESIRTEPVLELVEKNLSIIGFVQWSPFGLEADQ